MKSDGFAIAHLSFDGKKILSSHEGQNTLKIWDSEKGTLLDSIINEKYVTDAQFNTLGNHIVTTLGKVLDIRSHAIIQTVLSSIRLRQSLTIIR